MHGKKQAGESTRASDTSYDQVGNLAEVQIVYGVLLLLKDHDY